MLRAYARYARQIGAPYGLAYMADTLLAHPDVAHGLLALFRARFDPALQQRDEAVEDAVADVRTRIDAVTGLDADRILRSFLAMIMATLRTNWFRERPFFSFKIDPSAGAGHARAAAALRDLRVLAARRGRAPAVRPGRPGWSALVGPARRTSAPRSSAWSRRRR